MKLRRLLTWLCSILILTGGIPTQAAPLKEQFLNPGPDTRPGCYWYWINDNVSKEGITKDLEAMARVGIGRAYIGHIYNTGKGDKGTPIGDVKFMSDAWWEAVQWAVKEAGRCGVEIGFFNSPGWSQSGGPWVDTSQSMRYLASSETVIQGGAKIDLVLPVPEIKTTPTAGGSSPKGMGKPFTAEDFQDVRVIAFKQPQAEANDLDMQLAKASCKTLKSLQKLLDGSPQTASKLQGVHVIDFTFEKPQALQSLWLDPAQSRFTVLCKVESIEPDGTTQTLTEHRERRGHQGPLKADPLQIPFTPVLTRHLRVTLESGNPTEFTTLKLSRRAAVSYHVRKQLGETSPSTNPRWDAYQWPLQPGIRPGTAVDPESVMDLSEKVDAQGRLQWDAPKGNWVVIRTGMLPTGTQCHPASPQARGLEVDKMSRKHIRDHFDAMMGEFIRRTPAEDRKALQYVIADSYETGPQNWTDGMIQKFEKRFGYSPIPYLPCLSGRVVGSPDISTRFLWDWRRLIADSIAYDYVGGLREIANEHGLKLWLENYGHWGFPSEFLLYGSQADQVGGEFWESATIHGNIECRAAASSAHTYGRDEVYVEAFTSSRNFKQSPADLKSINDWVFAAGANQLILHVFIHQPDERKPGIIQWFGTAFNRHNTWFDQSKAFIDYLRRSATLLKAGTPAIDIAYYIGQNAPVMTGPIDPPLPDGYDFDHINADVLINHATVVDGRICIANGPSYSVLVLPKQTTMTPEVAQTIRQLVSEGATVFGPQPQTSPSLAGYPESDKTVAALTDPVWNRSADTNTEFISFGKGKVFSGTSLETVMTAIKLDPDITVSGSGTLLCAAAGAGKIGRDQRGGIVFKHRTTDEHEIYFLANTTDHAADLMASFRIAGRQPWLWDANAGKITKALAFSQEASRTEIPIHLEAAESIYVVFEDDIAPDASGSALSNHQVFEPARPLAGPWKVSFDGLGAPKATTFEVLTDWSQHSDPAIRNFSGKATYTTRFEWPQPAQYTLTKLDLGRVGILAEVTLNGHDLGTVWTTPWEVDLSPHLKPGANTLQIRVTSTWNNRLTSDSKLPTHERLSYVSQAYRKLPKDALQPSGLIGPVTIKQSN